MSSQEKIKKVSKTSVKKPMIVEDSDDDCETMPIQRSKAKAKALEATKNPFIDYESVENPEECEELEAVGEHEIDYVASDVEEVEEQKVQPEEKGNEDKEEGGERNEVYEGGEDYVEEEPDLEEDEVEELLPCFLCKSDMKIVTKNGQQMLFCSAGASVCTPPFTTPATYLALREMSKAVHPSYLHTKKGTPPRCHKHNIPMALSFCKSSSEKFADRPVFKCADRAGRNPFTNREDSTFVKCPDGLFGDIDNLAKARNDYTNYQAQIIVEKARAIRSKNLVVKSLKCQEEQDRLAGKKRKATSNGNSTTKSKISSKTTLSKK